MAFSWGGVGGGKRKGRELKPRRKAALRISANFCFNATGVLFAEDGRSVQFIILKQSRALFLASRRRGGGGFFFLNLIAKIRTELKQNAVYSRSV